MEPWYRVVEPRKEVREGRSFNPAEFAIALEQVVAGTAPEDYRNASKFFARTCFTRALREHSGLVLRRLAGKTENSAPVLTLITQFGGGKTHTLTTLFHLAREGRQAQKDARIAELVKEAGLSEVPAANVAVFVGNSWDPLEGRETPWIDIARQLAGNDGVAALGPKAKKSAPGTEAIGRLVSAAGGSVLILLDEVLNYLSRYKESADGFRDFLHNLTVALTGSTRSAAVISLPQSHVELSEWDEQWQDRITKVVGRVATHLIVNDEAEIGEVVRRRLFEDLGKETTRKAVARAYADWCFERRASLPREWMVVDTASTDAKAKEFLRGRFESCYPFHPATLSVFQRKWHSLRQYQQTRGTLAMFAQWISWAYRKDHEEARREPLITLGSAPLWVPEFRAVVLGQLGEPKLLKAIEADISGQQSHARALDADSKDALKDIHRRVGTTILFESSGGQGDKYAHLPELRFALCGPEVETTSIDNAANSLEASGFYIRRAGSDAFRFGYKPTLKKVANDRRASLEEKDIREAMRTLVRVEFKRSATIPVEATFLQDGADVSETTKLTLIVVDPEMELDAKGELQARIAAWTKNRGKSPRMYPGALLWCMKKPGRELRDSVEQWLAWQRVELDVRNGHLREEFDHSEKAEIAGKLKDAEEIARDQVWNGYRHVALADPQQKDGVRVVDLGAGHYDGSKTLCGLVLSMLKSESLLNESPGAGYLERRWPAAFKETGGWPLMSLRQAFLNGSLDRLIDPEEYLRQKVPEFVEKGEFGLGSGNASGGGFQRLWFSESMSPDEVTFEADVYLVGRARAKALKAGGEASSPGEKPEEGTGTGAEPPPQPEVARPDGERGGEQPGIEGGGTRTIHIRGNIPPEVWNRLGTKLLPKLRGGSGLRVGVEFSASVEGALAPSLQAELRQVLAELSLSSTVSVELI